jgi:hypothetical protein
MKKNNKISQKQREINKKVLDELEFGFTCTRKVHQGWLELQQNKTLLKKLKNETGFGLSNYFGKWQYVYESSKGYI